MNILINPGSGSVENGSKEQSEMNIKQFISDLGINGKYEFVRIEKDGRHTYNVWDDNYQHEIEMPAIPLENVRYLGSEGQKIFDFPRLYVDGSSWAWKYALNVCFNDDAD
jgi:hypothetical protein